MRSYNGCRILLTWDRGSLRASQPDVPRSIPVTDDKIPTPPKKNINNNNNFLSLLEFPFRVPHRGESLRNDEKANKIIFEKGHFDHNCMVGSVRPELVSSKIKLSRYFLNNLHLSDTFSDTNEE